MVADAGLPVPPGVEVVDLAVVLGTPGSLPVLDAPLAEVVVGHALCATEAVGSDVGASLRQRLPSAATVSHEELKQLCRGARFLVRTGEATPYANAVLQAGAAF